VIVDFIHVLEYLWKAAWSLHENRDPAAEAWVAERGRDLLAGKTQHVIYDLDRVGHEAGLTSNQRKGLDDAITYLTGKKDYLRYDKALKNGWPIATGIIEGACRHLVKDRMDITGARWGLGRRRSRPETPSPAIQRRLRPVLDLPHPARTPAQSPRPVQSRTHTHEHVVTTPLQEPHSSNSASSCDHGRWAMRSL
jgi:hypothetical protein